MAQAQITLKPPGACRWDLVALGEVMLRLDPGEGRVASARTFQACEGGGEYNVARGLRRVFGLRSAIVTALADNAVGRLVEDLMLQGGVDVSHLRWVEYDGIGRAARNGLNFTERGFGLRGGLGCSDRGHTAVSQLRPGEIDWERIFGEEGARWFHTGGIFCALSESAPQVAREAMACARRHGTIVSYDLNYRDSLWRDRGGKAAADALAAGLAPQVDVMLGAGGGAERAAQDFPDVKVMAWTLRNARSASLTDWGAQCWAGDRLYRAAYRENLPVLDRVGSGDAFAAGLIYALLAGRDLQYAIDCGAALGAHTMTTPGDQATATLAEVEALMHGAAAGLAR